MILRQKHLLMGLCFAGLMSSLTMALWLPPFAAPDEPAHWYRAVHVSGGHVFTTKREGQLGALLPSWAPGLYRAFHDGQPYPYGRIDASVWARAKGVTEDARMEFATFNNTAMYPPFFYVFQAAAIGVCRVLHVQPLVTFYCARLINTALTWALIAAALIWVHELAFFWAALLLLPIVSQQLGTLSPDAGMVACAMCLAAALRRAMVAQSPEPKLWGLATVCIALLAQARPPLLALTSLLWTPALARHVSGSILRFRLIGTFSAAAFAAPWFVGCLIWGGKLRPELPEVSVRAAEILHAPWAFLRLLLHTTQVESDTYLWMLTCGLGWFDAGFRGPAYTAAKVTLAVGLLLALGRNFCVRTADAVCIWAAMVGSYAAMQVVFFLTWTAPQTSVIAGFQGRYMLMFLPLLPLALPRIAWPKWVSIVLGGVGLCSATRMMAAVPWTLLERYYLHSP